MYLYYRYINNVIVDFIFIFAFDDTVKYIEYVF